MSWLFGLRKDPIPDFSAVGGNFTSGSGSSGGEGQPPSSGGSNSDSGGSDDKRSMGAYRFDSSALERAAKAARELELSPNAKEYLNLAKLQEVNMQLEKQMKIKEHEAYIEGSKSEQVRVQHEERRKTLAEETKHKQMVAQYQDQLARKRYDEQLLQQQRANEENLRKQEESVIKQEALKRATFEKELEARSQSDMKKIETEIRAKGKIERENQDLYLEQIRLKAVESRMTVLESLKTSGSILGAGFNAFISDWGKISASVAGITMMVLGYYTVKRGTSIGASYLQARLGRPKLLQETSRLTLVETFKHPIQVTKRLMLKPKDVLQGVVLNPSLEERLSNITIQTRNTKKNKGKYRNLLLHGPPGTGKTLFVKRLAQHCGMDYAIMSGSDVMDVGPRAVSAIKEVFNWADSSRKGLLLFIDEAEAFLQKRSSESISENIRGALTSILQKTGGISDRFMLVLATNTPEQLDWAMNNRMAEVVHFKLPGLAERERMIRLYFDEFVLIPATTGKRKLKLESFDYGKTCSDIASMTKGLCGREIVQLATSWEAASVTADDGVLTKDLIMAEVHKALVKHEDSSKWMSAKEAEKQILDSPVSRTLRSRRKDRCLSLTSYTRDKRKLMK